MATVRTNLQLYDQFSGVLSGVIRSLNLTISAMSDVQDAMDRGFDTSAINAARAAIQQTEAELRTLMAPIEQAEAQQNQLAEAFERTERSASGLVGTIKRLVGAYLTIEGARRLVEATIGGAMQEQLMRDMFIARAGDAGEAMFQTFKQQALEAGQDVNRYLQSALSFLSVTQDVGLLTQLNELATRLAAFDTTGQGIEGAAFALKEALSGDIVSLAERFNMSRSLIRALGIDQLGKEGNIEGFIQAMDELLERQRMGEEAFARMMESPAKQAEMLGNNIRSALAGAGAAALAAIAPLIATLNEGFREGRYDAFFTGLQNGLATVTGLVTRLVDGALWLGGVITTNWPVIEPVIWGIVAAMGAWWYITHRQAIAQGLLAVKSGIMTAVTVAQIAATYGLAEAWRMLNATMKANIIVGIIAALAALGVWLYRTWQTNDQFAAGVLRAWNAVLNFFDQVPIFFARVGFGILNAMLTAKVKTLEIVQGLVNGVIEAINWLIERVNRIPGISIQALEQVEFASRAAVEAEAARQAAAATIAEMEAQAALRAAEREQRVADFLANRAALRAQQAAEQAMPDLSALASGPLEVDSVGTVDEVGKVRDSVDISSEDLRALRELAEIRQHQYFVTLQPQLTFGPTLVRQDGRSIDEIIEEISKRLQEEIVSSAKAVFT